MTDNTKLESLAFRLKDLESLRRLFAELNYEFADVPVYKKDWNQSLKDTVVDSRIIAKKNDFLIYYIKTESNSIRDWKNVATKIISSNNGFCLVCSHNPAGFQWLFSSLSKEYSKSFSETRHMPIEIKPSLGIPKTFTEFLESIEIEDSDKGITIFRKISSALDLVSLQIHDELSVNVFEAMKTLSEGIINDKNNNLELNDETLNGVRSPIFILLYRIIFILYAEDREIFPIENKTYLEEFSLRWIKQNWFLKPTTISKLKEYEVQNRLKKLFHLIEVGSEGLEISKDELNMRSYYGRLFDRKIHSRLESWKIPNKFILQALDYLSRTKDKKGNYFFLDYSVLEIRHLGAIYEHLLEFHLTTKGKKIADLPNPEERKETGSYYTPKYVVDHIVEESVEPFIKKINEESIDIESKIEKILSLKILDPAMGSGHFLAGAVEYVAKRICEIEHGDVLENDFIERKRDVVRRCIYGVDVIDLAVDLAKLSLWLETLSSEKPLSFLSAHLKHGNSLLGEKFENIFDPQQTLIETTSRTYLKKIVKDFLGFEAMEDDTSSAVRAKIEKYQKMHGTNSFYSKFRGILDTILAGKFGIKVPPIGDLRQKIGEGSIDFYSSDSGESVFEFRKHKNLFHWELEFPEIFYNVDGKLKDNPGFDIIIGNPPWVFTRGKHFSKEEKKYFDHYIKKILELIQNKKGSNVQSGKLNLYSLFLLYCIPLLKNGGILNFILPNNILRTTTYDLIRKYILENCKIRNITNLSVGVFEGVTVSSITMSLQRESDVKKISNNDILIIYDIDDISTKKYRTNKIKQKIFHTNTSYNFNILLDSESIPIIQKIKDGSTPLGILCDYISEGIVGSRIKDVFDVKKNESYKPFIVGKDIGRYEIDYKNKFVRYDRRLLHRARPEEMFLADKILVQRISGGTRPINATIDKNQFYTFASINNIILKKSVQLTNEYICALLNSDLINWYYSINFSNKSIVTVNLSKTYLEKIPIRKISSSEQKNISKMVTKTIKNKNDLLLNSNNHELKERIKTFENQINDEIYKIYEISLDERKTIEKFLSS